MYFVACAILVARTKLHSTPNELENSHVSNVPLKRCGYETREHRQTFPLHNNVSKVKLIVSSLL